MSTDESKNAADINKKKSGKNKSNGTTKTNEKNEISTNITENAEKASTQQHKVSTDESKMQQISIRKKSGKK